MKREILCSTCENKIKGELGSYPGEHIKWKKGYAKNEYICDQCGKDIPKGVICFALSIWADYGGIKYYPWEHEYLDKIKE